MKKYTTASTKTLALSVILFSAFFCSEVNAQTIIHETNAAATPDAQAALEVVSTTKGVLFPNLSTSQMTSLPSPTAGLMIYCRSDGKFYFYNGTTWRKMTPGAAVPISHTMTPGTDKGVGVGLDDPDNSALLHVNANNKGVLLPRMTAAQKTAITANAAHNGMIVYESTTNDVWYCKNGVWTAVTDVADAAPNASVGTAAGVIIGTGTVDASAKLEIKSTAGGFLIPRMTTAERNAILTPAEGLLIYNTTDHQIQYYVSGSWYPWT